MAVRNANDATSYDVVLLPTFTQVEGWRKRHAVRASGGLFAQTVTTFNAWIADLWELYGDGRAIVDSVQRQVIMQAAFDQMADEDGLLRSGASAAGPKSEVEGIVVSHGVVKLAARCVREAAGLPAFEKALDEARRCTCPAGLAIRESAFLRGIDCYRELLFSASLVEVGQAAAYLARHADEVFHRPCRVLLENAAPLNWQMTSFFDACKNIEVDVRVCPGAEGVGRLGEGVEVRFGFPSGRYAQPALVSDLVQRFVEERCAPEAEEDVTPAVTRAEPSDTVVVACKDPLNMGKQLEQACAGKGVALSVQAQVPFASTDFGRCYLSLSRATREDRWAIEDVSDAVRPPFSGYTADDALSIDAQLRKDRIAGRDDVLATLRAASDTFSQLEEVTADPDADILLGVFDQIAFSAPGRSDSWRAEQLSAVGALRACTSAARLVGAEMDVCVRALEEVSVGVSYECDSEGEAQGASAAHVLVTTQGVAAQMGPGSCDALVLCDLTSEDYPIADKDDAARTLFDKLGLFPTDTALARARRTFRSLQDLPTGVLACVRPMNDWDGGPTYPAAVLQEFVDAYRDDATSDDDLDEVFGLPSEMLVGMVQRGEELLFANAMAANRDALQPMASAVNPNELGDVTARNTARVALARRIDATGSVSDSPDAGSGDQAAIEGRMTCGFAPSPSQVETYLDCPYKWFVQSRLRVGMLDEGFGALERGTYAHAVLRQFYLRFQEEGFPKVDDSNIERARALMREVCDELERAQYELEPGSGRYVAVDQLEQRQLEACKEQLVSYLDFEAAFLPGFHPAYFEYAIAPEDGVTYAGRPFIGIVDRIDVDDAGNAVIVDYKGSLNVSHSIAGKLATCPGEVQARMYAQVVQRALGLHVVGALYVSYGKSRGVSGAVDARAIDTAHLPGAKPDRMRCAVETSEEALSEGSYADMSFADMLDQTELLVEHAITAMEEGRIQPAPATGDSCTYCPQAFCPKRGE